MVKKEDGKNGSNIFCHPIKKVLCDDFSLAQSYFFPYLIHKTLIDFLVVFAKPTCCRLQIYFQEGKNFSCENCTINE